MEQGQLRCNLEEWFFFSLAIAITSGGFIKSERGVQPLVRKAQAKIFGCHAHFRHVKVRTDYLEATLGLVKRLEISKDLIRECVTVPGCCAACQCCIIID